METRFTEVRADGRRLLGTVVKYGDVAVVGGQPERFAPGSLIASDVVLNVQHERSRPIARTGAGLILRDSPQGLEMEALLPETQDGRDCITLVSSGVLRGLSVEFQPIAEHEEDGTRVIDLANLSGLAVCDRPAYPASKVEARATSGKTLRAVIPAGVDLGCRCSGADCRYARFTSPALSQMIRDAFADDSRVIAAMGNYGSPLAAASRGTLRGSMAGDRAIVDLDIPGTEAGTALLEARQTTGVLIRPHLDSDLSEGEREGETMVYSKASVRAFIVGATDASEGWPNPELVKSPENRQERKGLRRLWL